MHVSREEKKKSFVARYDCRVMTGVCVKFARIIATQKLCLDQLHL